MKTKKRDKVESIFGEDNYSFSAESMDMTKTPKSRLILSRILIFILVAVVLCLIFVPWQQSITGVGKVTVFSPMERPQNIESLISARIKDWKVKEGDMVEKGQVLLELEDVAPKFLDPNQLKRLQLQKNAVSAKRNASIASADENITRAEKKVIASKQKVEASEQNLRTTMLNLTRLEELHSKGLRSKRDLELAELADVKAKTDLKANKAMLEVAKKEFDISKLDRNKIAAETNNELFKIEVDLQNIKSRVEQRVIKAPASGQIVRLIRLGSGETVKVGERLATIVPETKDQAVELYISDHDAPLISVGRPVRLQFAGWPAIQFTGWPSVAVGTFGGRVAVIDAVDDGRSRYRILVKPDIESIESGRDEPWPSSRYLRPGAKVIGWVLLDNVSLGFELWRQFNAFPPTVQREPIEVEGRINIFDAEKGSGSNKKKRKQ